MDQSPVAEKTTAEAAATPAVPVTDELEHFIPVSRFALLDHLRQDEKANSPNGETPVTDFFNYLTAWRHQSYQARLLRLKECYLPFSPDRDTVRLREYSEEDLRLLQAELVDRLWELLQRANYRKISMDELQDIMQAQSPYGLELTVDLDEFDEVLLAYRGATTQTIEKRDPRRLYLKKKKIEIPIYQRLFLLLKLKPESQRLNEIMAKEGVGVKKARKRLAKYRKNLPEDDHGEFIYLKMFKFIPREDLEMMFPNTQVKFRLFDKIRLGITAGGGTIAGITGSVTKLLAATNPITLAAALAGLVAVIFRQIMSFFSTRNKYMLTLAERLYFHSLADNRGVLTLLTDRGEEEDIKEDMLLYYFLVRQPVPQDRIHELDAYIEAFLQREFGVTVDFEIDDALERLLRDRLITALPNGFYEAVPPKQACRLLERRWRYILANPMAALSFT